MRLVSLAALVLLPAVGAWAGRAPEWARHELAARDGLELVEWSQWRAGDASAAVRIWCADVTDHSDRGTGEVAATALRVAKSGAEINSTIHRGESCKDLQAGGVAGEARTTSPGATSPSPTDAPQGSRDELLPPKILTRTRPAYTEEAKRAGIKGTVILEVVVGTDGRASNARVVQSLPMGLDEMAIAAVEQWTFSPAKRGSQAVAVHFTLTVNFKPD